VSSIKPLSPPVQLLGATIAFVSALLLALHSVLLRAQGFRIAPGPQWNSVMGDFSAAVYYPVVAFLEGANPYDRAHYLARYPIDPFAPYLPSTLLIHLPFGLLPQPVAAFWYLVVSVLLILMLALLSLKLNNLRVTSSAVLLLAALIILSRPGRQALLLGQVTLQVVLASYVALYYSRRAPRASGFGLAVALFKPTYGVPLALLMLVRGDKRAIGYATLFGLLLNLPVAAILAHRAGGIRPLVQQLIGTFEAFQTMTPANSPVLSQYRIDAAALVGRFVGHPPDGASQLLVILTVLGLAAVALRVSGRALPFQPSLTLSAGIVCAAVLLSVYHQPNDLLFLTLPFVAAARRRLPPALNSPRVRWSLLVPFIFLAWNYAASEDVLRWLGFLAVQGRDAALSRQGVAVVLVSLNGLALLALLCALVVAALNTRGSLSVTPDEALPR
jgi:hypothetical protein